MTRSADIFYFSSLLLIIAAAKMSFDAFHWKGNMYFHFILLLITVIRLTYCSVHILTANTRIFVDQQILNGRFLTQHSWRKRFRDSLLLNATCDLFTEAKNMGRKLDLSQLSEQECEQILKVIQKDFELRQKDKSRLEWVFKIFIIAVNAQIFVGVCCKRLQMPWVENVV